MVSALMFLGGLVLGAVVTYVVVMVMFAVAFAGRR